MLCLTLREGEYFMVGDDIKVMFVKGLGPDKMSVGIESPESVNIVRDKVYAKNLAGVTEISEKTPEEVALAEERLKQYKKARREKQAEKYRKLAKQRREA